MHATALNCEAIDTCNTGKEEVVMHEIKSLLIHKNSSCLGFLLCLKSRPPVRETMSVCVGDVSDTLLALVIQTSQRHSALHKKCSTTIRKACTVKSSSTKLGTISQSAYSLQLYGHLYGWPTLVLNSQLSLLS